MTWLKKVGQAVLKGVGLVTGFLPLFQQTYGQGGVVKEITDDLSKIAGAIQTVEVVIGAVSNPDAKTGAQKLQAAIPLISQIVQQSEIVAGKKIKNEQLFIAGCQKMGDGMADILNALEA